MDGQRADWQTQCLRAGGRDTLAVIAQSLLMERLVVTAGGQGVRRGKAGSQGAKS